MSQERLSRKALKKSIKEYHDTKTLASFANISFKTDASRRRYIADEIAKVGKGNITAQTFTFKELNQATNNFNPDNQLGEGGFGRVYKGKLDKKNENQAAPLFKDRRKFTQMADPLMEGKYPIKGLYQALAVAAMCLQEEAETRPLMSDVVTALEFLAKKDGDDDGDDEVEDNNDTTQSSPDVQSEGGLDNR
ncbi:hypothetical protein ACFE04_023415 [Oxalis oulophora]